MTTTKRPVVLTIDDAEQNGLELRLRDRADVLARTPDQVTSADLRKANVVLIDYQIDDWPGREQAGPIALKPGNGVALAAVLRSQIDESKGDKRRAFAIHSGKLDELAGGLRASSREHAIARTLNLEWVFSKATGSGPALDVQVASLAAAVKALPKTWPEDAEKALKAVRRLLATPAASSPWGLRAAEDLESCNPPIHAWAVATEGMAFVRWLLHQVLPYPSFLWDERYLAARLRVTAVSLRQALAREKKAQRALEEVSYRGVLHEFLGPRWWRAGVEHLLWTWTEGEPFSSEAVMRAVRARVSKQLAAVNLNRPVVCVDPDSFRPTDQVVDAADAVEVKPDDWPPYAEQAWVSAAEARAEGLVALVVPQDRDRAGAD